VEPTTPCATKTFEEEKLVNHQVISGRRILTECGSSASSSRSLFLASISQVSTLREGGSTTNFTIARQDPTIRLPKFRGDRLDGLDNNFFIC
jgi:hypothetical protein